VGLRNHVLDGGKILSVINIPLKPMVTDCLIPLP